MRCLNTVKFVTAAPTLAELDLEFAQADGGRALLVKGGPWPGALLKVVG